jgi:glycine/D-amino acid oxidase-like deaminating enzyme
MRATKPKTIVVGAGIVGASIAYHLARAGAPVILVDKSQPAGAVTRKAFAWINVSHGVPKPYAALRLLAIQDYRRLERELGHALQVDWCGALTWHRDLAETERLAREHAAAGYDVRLIERDQIAQLEPNLAEPPRCAAYAASEGAVDPVATTAALVDAARQAGADIRLATEVIALASNGRGITGIRTRDETIGADAVGMAAGTDARGLCRPLGLDLPVDPSPALLLRYRTAGRLAKRIVSNPEMEIRQATDRCLLAADDYIDESPENGPDAIAGRALAAVKKHVRGAAGIELESVSVGIRPIPADGCPIVGFSVGIDGLYVAVMHAGVTMAPVVGRLATTEILEGPREALLDSCRPERFDS